MGGMSTYYYILFEKPNYLCEKELAAVALGGSVGKH